ncbi:unnamed protein product, partial [Didymodactylos carnosus]
MASFIAKTLVGNEFDKVMKGIGLGDNDNNPVNSDVSSDDLLAAQAKRDADDKQCKAKHAESERQREEVRQKIRDKKKDDKSRSPTHSPKATSSHKKQTTTVETRTVPSAATAQNNT